MSIHARVTDGRLHLYTYEDASGISAERELDVPQRAIKKTGIAIKKWYHLFSTATKIRIGNKSYLVNSNSLKKYLVRTSDIHEKGYEKYQNVALKAFEAQSSTIFGDRVNNQAESTRGLMLLRHAKVLDLRRNPITNVPRPSLTQVSIDLREEVTQESVWKEFFQREVEAFNILRENERIAQRSLVRPESLTPMQKFLQALNEACDLGKTFRIPHTNLGTFHLSAENREEILLFAQSLHPDQLQELATKMAISNSLIKKSAPYIQLKRQEKRLTDQEHALRMQISSFDARAAQKNEAHVFFQTVLQVLHGNLRVEGHPEAMVEIPPLAIEKIGAEAPSLGDQLIAYNKELKKLQEDHLALEERIELFERDLARRNETYLHYAKLRSDVKLILNGGNFEIQKQGLNFKDFVAQYHHLGLFQVRHAITSFQQNIETHEAYIKEPEIGFSIQQIHGQIEIFAEQIKILKSSIKPAELLKKQAELQQEIDQLEVEYIGLQVALTPEEAKNDLRLQRTLRILRAQIEDKKERRQVYGFLLTAQDKVKLIQEKEEAIRGLKVTLAHLQKERTLEIQKRKEKVSELKKIIGELQKICKMKEKELQLFANELAKKEGVTFKKEDLEAQVSKHILDKKNSAQIALYSLKAELSALNEQKERSLIRIREIAHKTEEHLIRAQPERLTAEQKAQIIEEYSQVSRDLSELKEKIHQEFHLNDPLMDEIAAIAGKKISLKEAFASGMHAHVLNLGFLLTAVIFDHGDITGRQEANLELRRNQILHQAQDVQKVFKTIGLEYSLPASSQSSFVFSGAQQSLFEGFPERLRTSDHPSYLMTRFLVYLREHSTRENASIRSRSDSLNQSFDSAYESLGSPSSATVSLADSSATSSDYLSSENLSRYITTFNPIYQELVNDIDPKNKLAQKFIRELEDFDITYFTHPDISKRLIPQEHFSLICPATISLYSFFVGGEDLSGIKLDYAEMIKYLQEKGSRLAKTIKERSTQYAGIPQDELAVVLSYYVFLEGLKDPLMKNKFIDQIKSHFPHFAEVLQRRQFMA